MAESKKTFNIFITGGSESAGLAAAKTLLANGHQVVAATNSADGALAIRRAGALPVYPDLTRESEVLSSLRMTNADVLVHAAPQNLGGLPQVGFDNADCLVKSSQAVLRAAKTHGLRKIIAISFAYLYAAHQGDPATEDAHNVHGGHYQPMLAAEAAWLDSGLNVRVIRAGYIYGGGSRATAALAEDIKRSRRLPDGRRPASWIHEDDLAAAIAALIEADDDPPAAEIINAAADAPQSPNDVAASLSHALGLRPPDFAVPGWMTRLRGETLSDKLLKREAVIDSRKIKARYSWRARYATIEPGMEATTLAWRMQEAGDPADFYNVYEDKAAAAIEAANSERTLPPTIAEDEKPAAPPAPKPKPIQASAPPPSDGPTPWNEDEAKREERRRKALERKAKRAAKRAAGD